MANDTGQMKSLREGLWKTTEQCQNGSFWGVKGYLLSRRNMEMAMVVLNFTLHINIVYTQGYLFYTLGYDPMQVYLTAQMVALFASVALFLLVG